MCEDHRESRDWGGQLWTHCSLQGTFVAGGPFFVGVVDGQKKTV